MTIRTYSELVRFDTFQDRYEYLKLGGRVGSSTFGFDRHLNQTLYHSKEWKTVRNHVIVRDAGCDLAVFGYEIHSGILVHHMNPIDVDDIIDAEDHILDPEFLITTTKLTHNAIHYGNFNIIPKPFSERVSGDTKLW